MEMNLKKAEQIIDAMEKYVSELKVERGELAGAFAAVDAAGILVCLKKMDGAMPLAPHMANNKAYTAISWKRDTKDMKEMFETEHGKPRRDIAWFCDSRYTPLMGGVLLKDENGNIVGAVGTGGLDTQERDDEVSRVGEKAWKEMLKG